MYDCRLTIDSKVLDKVVVFVVATRKIAPNEGLYTDYGDSYWTHRIHKPAKVPSGASSAAAAAVIDEQSQGSDSDQGSENL